MNKFKYVILALTIFIFNIHSISADCTEEALKEFKRVENKYTVKYEFNKSSKTYTMYFKNPAPREYYYQIYSQITINCTSIDDNTKKCINFPAGEYDVEILGDTDSCNDVLKKITINLPEYNKFSDDPLCEGIEEFVLCSPTYEKEIDYDTFVSRVKTYKKTKAKQEAQSDGNEVQEKENNQFAFITQKIKENLVAITIVITFVVLLIITIIITAKSIRKSRRLE